MAVNLQGFLGDKTMIACAVSDLNNYREETAVSMSYEEQNLKSADQLKDDIPGKIQ